MQNQVRRHWREILNSAERGQLFSCLKIRIGNERKAHLFDGSKEIDAHDFTTTID
jgi:hypothetical protein